MAIPHTRFQPSPKIFEFGNGLTTHRKVKSLLRTVSMALQAAHQIVLPRQNTNTDPAKGTT
jgi:hypothetical protein